jgi:hypothetical protein
VALLGEYLKGIELEKLCSDNLPKAKRNNGYSAFEFIYPLMLMLHTRHKLNISKINLALSSNTDCASSNKIKYTLKNSFHIVT